jgi:DNA polymerase-4
MATAENIWQGRAVLHVDLDAFFAAVEQLDHPEWRGKPVIVGGDASARGVVSTASYEARRFGIHSAMPSARAVRLCPHAIWAPARFERYRELSRAVRSIFESETPRVQPVSIDEAFLDVTPGSFSNESPVLIAERIRQRVATLGITCSAGLATSKTVAKIASDFQKPDGLTVVWPGTEAAFLAPLSVRVMSGIGPQTASRLETLGIVTLGELGALDDRTALQVLGSYGPSAVRRARGIDERLVHDNEVAKSVSNERTFAVDVHDAGVLDRALEELAHRVSTRLRSAGFSGRTVTVKLRHSDFTTRTIQRTLPAPTADVVEFLPVARDLLHSIWSPGVGVRLLGVGVSGFEERAEQLDLFGDAAESGKGSTSRSRSAAIKDSEVSDVRSDNPND